MPCRRWSFEEFTQRPGNPHWQYFVITSHFVITNSNDVNINWAFTKCKAMDSTGNISSLLHQTEQRACWLQGSFCSLKPMGYCSSSVSMQVSALRGHWNMGCFHWLLQDYSLQCEYSCSLATIQLEKWFLWEALIWSPAIVLAPCTCWHPRTEMLCHAWYMLKLLDPIHTKEEAWNGFFIFMFIFDFWLQCLPWGSCIWFTLLSLWPSHQFSNSCP